MPRKRMAGKRRRADLLTSKMVSHLTHIGNERFFAPMPTEDDKRVAWEAGRADILAEWIAERPGTRPPAWWDFDSPERRRRIDGKPHPFDVPERVALVAKHERENPGRKVDSCRLSYGLPCIAMVETDWEDAEYEDEMDYLSRLDLLTDDERAALAELGS